MGPSAGVLAYTRASSRHHCAPSLAPWAGSIAAIRRPDLSFMPLRAYASQPPRRAWDRAFALPCGRLENAGEGVAAGLDPNPETGQEKDKIGRRGRQKDELADSGVIILSSGRQVDARQSVRDSDSLHDDGWIGQRGQCLEILRVLGEH